jgi:hypothetical protein
MHDLYFSWAIGHPSEKEPQNAGDGESATPDSHRKSETRACQDSLLMYRAARGHNRRRDGRLAKAAAPDEEDGKGEQCGGGRDDHQFNRSGSDDH